jgi:hypothetical protein
MDGEDNAGMKKKGPGGDLNAVSPAIERAWIDRTDKWDRPSGGDLNALLLAVDCGNIKVLVARCHSFFVYFLIFYDIHTSIQSHSYNTFLRRHSLRSLEI